MRTFAWGLLTLLLGCDGYFGPKSQCFPVSCDTLQRNCGQVDDGCGHLQSCGECPSGQVCGVTIANVCGTPPTCTPTKTCASVMAECGSIDNGCGQLIACPSMCSATECGAEGVPNQCSFCTPPTCAPGIGCGLIPNMCGPSIDCGACAAPFQCGAQQQNVCGCPMGQDCGPPAPTLFLAGVAWNRIDLAWSDPDTSVQDFELQRAVNGGAFVLIGPVGTVHHSADVTALMPGTTLSYQVRADQPSASGWSNAVTVTVPAHDSVWRTVAGDVAHSGFNSAETARPPGTLRWERVFDGGTLQPVVSEPPAVIAVAGSTLYVFDLDGGLTARQPLPGGNAGQPAVFDHRVFVGCDLSPMPDEYLAFDLTGGMLWAAPQAAAGGGFWAPISTGEAIAGSSGASNALVLLDEATGKTLVSAPVPTMSDWTPSLSNGVLAVYTGGMLQTVDVATGAIINTMPIPANPMAAGWATLDGDSAVIVAMPGLAIFTSGQLRFVAPMTPFIGQVAVADPSIYANTVDTLQRLDQGGTVTTWSFPTDGGLAYPPLVAAGVAYVSSDTTVFAVDTSTGQQLWTTSPGGWLSIAGGMLFVASPDRLRAYALTP